MNYPIIQIVIVLYKTRLEDSLSYQTLSQHISNLKCKYFLLVYNNSPEVKVPESSQYELHVAQQNDMLAIPYNMALCKAKQNNADWILLLDQDTKISADYFSNLNSHLLHVPPGVAALLPQIHSPEQKQISPWTYTPVLGAYGIVRKAKTGLLTQPMAAFNSCAVLRVDDIVSIGGFPTDYPLDNLDTCYLYRLWQKRKLAFVFESGVIQNLSQLDYTHNMTPQRYAMIMESTKRIAKEQGFIARCVLLARLCVRCIRQCFYADKRKYVRMTLQGLIK